MGATDFNTFLANEPRRKARTMEEAYRAACKQAEREAGEDPYNGTISTTSGVRRWQSTALTITQAQRRVAELWAEEDAYANKIYAAARKLEEAGDFDGASKLYQRAEDDGPTVPKKWEQAWAIEIKKSELSHSGWLFFGIAAC